MSPRQHGRLRRRGFLMFLLEQLGMALATGPMARAELARILHILGSEDAHHPGYERRQMSACSSPFRSLGCAHCERAFLSRQGRSIYEKLTLGIFPSWLCRSEAL